MIEETRGDPLDEHSQRLGPKLYLYTGESQYGRLALNTRLFVKVASRLPLDNTSPLNKTATITQQESSKMATNRQGYK